MARRGLGPSAESRVTTPSIHFQISPSCVTIQALWESHPQTALTLRGMLWSVQVPEMREEISPFSPRTITEVPVGSTQTSRLSLPPGTVCSLVHPFTGSKCHASVALIAQNSVDEIPQRR